MIRLNEKLPFIKKCSYKTAISNQISISQITDIKYILNMKYFLKLILNFFLYRNLLRPDFLYSLVYSNFFQRSNVVGRNKNKNKMSQNKDKT